MKIKIIYDENQKLLKIPVLLKIPHKRIKSDFVLDTGSPHTILNYSDSIRLAVPHISKGEIVRIGGRRYQSYIFNKFEIVFKTEDNQLVNVILPVRVLKPSSLKMNEVEELDRFPNLLGLDFLEKGYKLFCDLKNKESFLEVRED